jgi:hypothetical protein
MSATVCGDRLVVPINRDGDWLLSRDPESQPGFVACVTQAVCELPPGHAGDHRRAGSYGEVPLLWARGEPTGVGWPT